VAAKRKGSRAAVEWSMLACVLGKVKIRVMDRYNVAA
jgi:hypothetical protein